MLVASYRAAVKQLFQQLVQVVQRYDPRVVGGIVAGVLLLALLVWWIVRLRRPSAEELERRRREKLVSSGRITDGHLLDARSLAGEESVAEAPEVLVYSYRCAGVTYNCAQDVSLLPELVKGYRIDQPLQVRYEPQNPGNSIIVAQNWSGLWRLDDVRLRKPRPTRMAG